MGQQKKITLSMGDTAVKIVSPPDEKTAQIENQTEKSVKTEAKQAKLTIQKKVRSKKYQTVRSQVDKTRLYDAFAAVELIKKLSYSTGSGTITAHLLLKPKHQGDQLEIQFPHSTGKSLRVEIATLQTLNKITDGKIDFDVLLATPDMMPKLAKHAAVLGPRGLMPNPKQGTLLSKPEQRKKELETGKINLRTERKAPLMHVVIGNTKMETKQLVENLQVLINVTANNLLKLTLAATMSPGVKVALEN